MLQNWLFYIGRMGGKPERSCLIQDDDISFTYRNKVNLFNVYELHMRSRDWKTDLALCDCLFRSVKLSKSAGLFKYVWPFCYHQALKG